MKLLETTPEQSDIRIKLDFFSLDLHCNPSFQFDHCSIMLTTAENRSAG